MIRETPEPESHGPAVPLIDITEEDTVPFNNNVVDSENEVEILRVLPLTTTNPPDTTSAELLPPVELEPLDPEIEFRQNVTRIFFDIDRYARSIFDN